MNKLIALVVGLVLSITGPANAGVFVRAGGTVVSVGPSFGAYAYSMMPSYVATHYVTQTVPVTRYVTQTVPVTRYVTQTVPVVQPPMAPSMAEDTVVPEDVANAAAAADMQFDLITPPIAQTVPMVHYVPYTSYVPFTGYTTYSAFSSVGGAPFVAGPGAVYYGSPRRVKSKVKVRSRF